MRRVICFLFLFALNIAFAQNKRVVTEEEYLILKYKISLNFNANVDSALVYANQMAKSNNNKHLAFANGVMSSLLQGSGKTKLSQEKYRKALYYWNQMPDSHDKLQVRTYIYNYEGLAELARRNYGASLENFQRGIKLSEKIRDINQIFKMKANISLVNEAVGNYRLAIKNSRELIDFLHENKDLFPKEEFINRKSNVNFSLGSSYEGYFMANQTKWYLLDSAEYFYKRSIAYSSKFISNTITSKLSLGNIYYWRDDYKNAIKTYHEVLLLSQQNNNKYMMSIAYYNLADVYTTCKKYDKALWFYAKSDSIAVLTNQNQYSFLRSNYHQSKIYTILKKPELAYKHSKIYLDSKEKYETKLNKETAKVNHLQGIDNLTKEMVSVEENYKKEVFFQRILKVFFTLLFVTIVFLLIFNTRHKNEANKRMNTLIQEFKSNIERKNFPKAKIVLCDSQKIKLKKENITLCIDQAKEKEIVQRLLYLESNLEYLNTDFTLIYVAKKIKTNTTYLSYVVNKRFEKTFSEYANELKINYAINEMITNEIYRKSSTQIIAESVGFKNADSFAKSFRKRTGVSPAQFANNI
jgi:AraC-like DNA-binding protein